MNQESGDFNQVGKRLQSLIKRAETLPDPSARALFQESIRTILDLHGQGLERMLQLIGNAGPAGLQIRDALAQDKMVATLLLIHGLHPVDLETRMCKALDKVRPYLQSHGGNVEVIGIDDDIARIRLQGTCKTCPSSAITLELAVRRVVNEACPDLTRLEVEGVEAAHTGLDPSALPVWEELKEVLPLSEGDSRSVELKATSLLLCRVNNRLYAYQNLCPVCGLSFAPRALEDGVLRCQRGHTYDVVHAGVSPDHPEQRLTPVPLIEESNSVKVSVN